MRKWVFIIILAGLSVILYRATREDKNSVVQQLVSDVKKMVNISPLSKEQEVVKPSSVIKAQEAQETQPTEAKTPNNIESLQNLTVEELQQWIALEAKAMNSTGNNTQETQLRLKAQAATLTPAQLTVLKQLATNSSLAVNDRILSAYLISLNTAASSQENLFAVAKAELPDTGPVLPHSEAEIKHTQELAIRYMQIDELFERAKTDANARDKLKLLIHEASSEQVRNYAKKKLQQLK